LFKRELLKMTEKNKQKEVEFVESLNYPAKNLRSLGKWPISVPKDPLIKDFTPFKGKPIAPKNFYYALFFTAFDVRDYGPQIKKFMKIFAPLSIKKVYLETYRDGYTVDIPVIEDMKQQLVEEGYEVSGAVTTTHFSDKTKNETPGASGCFTDKEANKKMKKVFEITAGIFDEIIIDDWFFTACECADCKKAKGKKTWQEYRSKLLADVSKKFIIEPAKKVNPNVNIILKLPQWYERFYDRGYDLDRLIPLYDEIGVGTETRDYKHARFLPAYGSMFFKYIKNLAPDKVKKAWFDIYQCDKEIYTEQAFQSVLGGAEEIILFCAGIMPQPLMRPLVEELIEKTDKMGRLSSFGKIFTIPMIRKSNTYGDELLAQYFLMAGIPAYLTDKRVIKEKIAILTAQSAKKEDFPSLFTSLIKNRKNIVMTVEAAKNLKKYFEIEELNDHIQVDTISFRGAEELIDDTLFISSEIQNGKRIALVNNAYSFISGYKIKGSTVWVINLPYTTDELEGHMGNKFSANFRYILHSPIMIKALTAPFEPYANLTLYEAIKTFYKYKV
jgi:hypothetical protein